MENSRGTLTKIQGGLWWGILIEIWEGLWWGIQWVLWWGSLQIAIYIHSLLWTWPSVWLKYISNCWFLWNSIASFDWHWINYLMGNSDGNSRGTLMGNLRRTLMKNLEPCHFVASRNSEFQIHGLFPINNDFSYRPVPKPPRHNPSPVQPSLETKLVPRWLGLTLILLVALKLKCQHVFQRVWIILYETLTDL